MTPDEMCRAASVLEREADALWQGHSLNGGWVLLDDADIAARADHNEMLALAAKLRALAESPSAAYLLVQEQAEDEGLWFKAPTAPEAYLQHALRTLHAAVEESQPLPPPPQTEGG